MTLKLDSLWVCPFCKGPWPREHGPSPDASL